MRGVGKMENVCEYLDESRIIVICRRLEDEYLIPTAEALYEGGIRLMEVTFDTSGMFPRHATLSQIEALRKHFDRRMSIGAGTVLSEKDVDEAFSAGASFTVSPDANPSVIAETKRLGMISVPGAYTPTEIQSAHLAGADYIKIFPANIAGADYFRMISTPLAHIKMLAVGNMDEKTIPAFRAAGAYGFAVGTYLLNRTYMEQGKFDLITANAARVIEAAKGKSKGPIIKQV